MRTLPHIGDGVSDPDAKISRDEGRLFLGESDATREVRRLIGRAAKVDTTVLITGESGVGKELVAREIHLRSARRNGPFIPLNCAAIPDTLIEAELFGHEPGAFTDARVLRRGAFELAHTGTLFLDEVGDLSAVAQPKLLRALESCEILRVGGERVQKIDIRIVAATNHNLKAMARDGRFRSDLYFRLGVFTIPVPPLRDRKKDLSVLAEHFARELSQKLGHEFTAIDADALEFLQAYHWPGNVRELRSVVERALAMHSGDRLDLECFELDPVSLPGISFTKLLDKDWKSAREGFEAAYAKSLLSKHGGSAKKAARDAAMATGSFYKMLRRLGLRPGSDDS